MQINLLIVSLIFSLSLHCTEVKQEKATQQEGKQKTIDLQKKKDHFVKRYNASYTPNEISPNCRPSIYEGQTGIRQGGVTKESIEQAMGCMLAGKNIFFDMKQTLRYLHDFQKDWLKDLGVQSIVWSFDNRDYGVLFTPEGKINAYLFIKAYNEFPNHFITGYLLNYPEDDVRAFYKHKQQVNEFEKEKKESLEWIEKNKPTIEEWIKNPEN